MSRYINTLTERWNYGPIGENGLPEDEDDDGLKASEPKIQLDSEGQNTANGRQSSNCRRDLPLIVWAIFGCLTLIIVIVAVRLLKPSPKIWPSCGDDPATARARGCQFDVINFAWQTRECFDASLVAEFAELEPWIFWTSKYGNETVSHEVAYRGEQPLWTTWRHHLTHCTYGWRKMHRAYEAGWIDKHLREFGHTKHCAEFVLLEGEEEERGRFFRIGEDRHLTYLNIVYPVCERLERGTTKSSWWQGEKPR